MIANAPLASAALPLHHFQAPIIHRTLSPTSTVLVGKSAYSTSPGMDTTLPSCKTPVALASLALNGRRTHRCHERAFPGKSH